MTSGQPPITGRIAVFCLGLDKGLDSPIGSCHEISSVKLDGKSITCLWV